jgi:chemotaxis protein histidine kinase CheA
MSTVNKDSKVEIILNGPEDWVGWNREFTAKMKLLQLHDYLVHKKELLEEPPARINAIKEHTTLRNRRVAEAKAGKHTDYMNHDDDDPEAENASQSSDSETLEDPAPEPDQAEEGAPPVAPAAALPAPPEAAAAAAAATAAKKAKEAKIKKVVREVQDYFKNNMTAIINELVRNHEAKRKAWKEQQTNLLKADAFLTISVSQLLRNSHFSEGATLRQWYDNLRSVAQKPLQTEAAIRGKLNAHVEALKATKHQSINQAEFERWLTKWESIMEEATLYNLAETTTIGLWFDQFIGAIANPIPSFAATFQLQGNEQGNALTFRWVAEKLRQVTPILLEARPSRVNKGSFPAFGQPSDGHGHGHNHEETPPKKNNLPMRKRGISNPNGNRADEKPQCRACLGIHKTGRCFYLYPELAPEGWHPRDHVRERVEENLKQDPTLRAEAGRHGLKAKKSKSNLLKGGPGKKQPRKDQAEQSD